MPREGFTWGPEVGRGQIQAENIIGSGNPTQRGQGEGGEGDGREKGLGPLGKWLKPLEDIRRGQSKVEDEGGGGEVSVGLGPGVRTLRSRFEERRAECPEDPGVERDPAKPGSGER